MAFPCGSPGSFSDWAEQKILEHIVGIQQWSSPSSLWVALGTTSSQTHEPQNYFVELSVEGYYRQEVVFGNMQTDNTQERTWVENLNWLLWGATCADWPVINHLAIFDSATGGNWITTAPLGTNIYIVRDYYMNILPGNIEVGIERRSSVEHWSKYLQEKIVSHVYLGEAYSQPDIYAALPGSVSYTGTGSTLSEPSGGYSRPLVNDWDNATHLLPSNEGQYCALGSRFDFGIATSNWFAPSQQHFLAFVDASSGGNLLAYGTTSISQWIYTGDEVYIAGTNVALGLN